MEMPNSPDSEKIVLSCLLVNPDILQSLRLTDEDFYLSRHKHIFNAIGKLARLKKPVDAVTVCDALSDKQLRAVGGLAYLIELLTYCPEPTLTAERATLVEGLKKAKILREYHQRRKMLLRAQEMARKALDETQPLRWQI